MPTRRTTVLGLGSLLAGGGAILGTGAFASVGAQRSVALETADDADAFLAFEVLEPDYVGQDGGVIQFELIADARTTFGNLVAVRNQGTQVVRSLRFEFIVTTPTGDPEAIADALSIVSGDATIPADRDQNLLVVSDEPDAGNDVLAPGESIPFGIAVDLTGDEIDAIDADADIALRIIADTAGDDAGNGTEPADPSPPPGDRFVFDEAPTINGAPPRHTEFTVRNDGSPGTVTGFTVSMGPPGSGQGGGGGSVPNEFEGFEITVDGTVVAAGSAGVYSPNSFIEHDAYDLDTGETATYAIEGFDANLNNNSFEITIQAVGHPYTLETEFGPGN